MAHGRSLPLLFFTLLLLSFGSCQLQWNMLLKGDTVYPDASMKGIATATGNPGRRTAHTFSFDGVNNELWIYGGTSSNNLECFDLWKYSVSSGRWTWFHGSCSTTGTVRNPGSQGVASTVNHPGSRTFSISWINPVSGEFWLYGGERIYFYADLWKFSPSTGMWTWVSGVTATDTAGWYGSKTVPSTGNHPGSRSRAAAWFDNGSLYLFGGMFLIRNSGSQEVNNVMRYTIADNTWTWLAGTTTHRGGASVGAKGVFSTNHYPSARAAGAYGYDSTRRELWLYGGTNTASSPLSDVWCYRMSDLAFATMSSAQTNRLLPAFGPVGVESSSYSPGSTQSAIGWFDSVDSTFWIFGGYGWSGTSYSHVSTSLWRFRVSADAWTIVAGGNTNFPAASPTYITPQIHYNGAVGWSQTLKTAFVFGGQAYGGPTNNEVWKFGAAPPVAAPTAPPAIPPTAPPAIPPTVAPASTPPTTVSAPRAAPVRETPTAPPRSTPTASSPNTSIRNPPVSSPTVTAEAPLAPVAQIFVSIVGQAPPNSSYVDKVCLILAESYSPPLNVGSDLVCRVSASTRRNLHENYVIVGDVMTRTAANAVLAQNSTSTAAVTQALSSIDPQYSVSAVSSQAAPTATPMAQSAPIPTTQSAPMQRTQQPNPYNASPSDVGVVSSSINMVPSAALVVGLIGALLCSL